MLQYCNTTLCLLSIGLSVFALSLLLTHNQPRPAVDLQARQQIESLMQLEATMQSNAQAQAVRLTRLEIEVCRNASKAPRLFNCP